MRSRLTQWAIVAAVAVASLGTAIAQQQPPPPPPANVAGKWTMALEMEMGTATTALELKQDGAKLTGTYTGRYGSFPLTGTVKERAIEFAFKMNADGTEVDMAFSGEVAADGQTMKGRAELGGGLGEAGWSAKRAK
jgi:hypothetical protein